ncbi:S41 family peptidase [Thermosipho ferrireducens]|uniref:S41 family peptidase n=1 Tax=Thermosipho ferrireducens TaxID=2571116 RepID=A0ABX7S3Y4_9BACT|nr:S41 family peptidase [Thermosipho ferrireducens]QTA37099.1 S41 family peptidase [Thermosipho ferrireducens]
MTSKKRFIGIMSIILTVILGSLILTGASEKAFQNNLAPIAETLYYIMNYYYGSDNLDVNKVVDYGIDGLIKGLGDDFSYYYNQQAYEEQSIDTKGEYGGLGIEVTYDSEYKAIKVISPMYGTPAWKAGLKSGDLIIEVDGTPVKNISYMEAINMMRGEPGTKVKLTILRGEETLTFEITREKIHLIPVKYGFIESDIGRIGYVRLTKFNEPATKELEKVLKTVYEKGIVALIFDLRNNPGGLLDTAVDVASMFLDANKLIVTVKPKVGAEERYVSKGNNFPEVPLVLLVNEGSASASEIVTAALKENNRAIVIGKKTFGKGSVQRGFPLSNGGVAFLTIAHYQTPSGKDIHKVGIEPNIWITSDATENNHKQEVVEYTKTHISVNVDDPYIKEALKYLIENR